MAHLMILLLVALTASSLSRWACVGAPSCDEVGRMVVPCVPYLADRAAMSFGPCCHEVVALSQMAPTRHDRIAVCRCLESAAPRFPPVDFARAAALPRLCGVVLHNFTISPGLDCGSLP